MSKNHSKKGQKKERQLVYITTDDKEKEEFIITLTDQEFDNDKAKVLGEEIALCKNLKKLAMHFSYYGENNGPYIATNISCNLYQLPQLEYLEIIINFKQNPIQSAKNLCKQIAECTNLSSLKISMGQSSIQSEGFLNCIKELNKCQNLKELELILCDSEIQSIQEAGQVLKGNKTIQKLNLFLAGNFFSTKDLGLFGDELAQNQCINQLYLNLSNMDIHQNVFALIRGLSASKSIKKLDLLVRNSKIYYEMVQELKESLSLLHNIESLTLDFQYNPIQISGYHQICQALQTLPKLQYLKINLSSQFYQDNEILDLMNFFGNFVQLKSLSIYLKNLNLVEEQIVQILEMLLKNKSLIYINCDFERNKIYSYRKINKIIMKHINLVDFLIYL